MGRVNCTENVWLSKVPLVPLRQPFCEKQGFGKSPWLRESVLRKKNRPRFLREHLLGNCRAPHARRHGRAVRPQNPARYLPGGLQIKPDIYQAVLNCYVAVLKTPLLMVHPSLGSQDKYWDEPDNLDNNVNRR